MFTKWAQVPNEKNVIFARGAELLILTPAWCHNELLVIAHGGKCCHCPSLGMLLSGLVPLTRWRIVERNVEKYGKRYSSIFDLSISVRFCSLALSLGIVFINRKGL